MTIDDERAAVRAQHDALEDLKRQLNERVEAVRARELELHHALADAGAPPPANAVARPPAVPALAAPADVPGASTGDDLEAQRQAEQNAAREREIELAAGAETMVGVPAPAAVEPDVERLAQIEARLAELRDAEKLFLRTRDELAARSEAVAARERLVAQKERELDDREDGVGQWASPGLSEMEARLRRLEQQQDPSEQTMGFSGGLRKLQQGTTRPQRDDR